MTERTATDQMKNQPVHEACVLGHRQSGGLVYVNGHVQQLSHANLRFSENGFGDTQFYNESHIREFPFPLEEIPQIDTVMICQQHLEMLAKDIRPSTNTSGIEFEGAVYDQRFNLRSAHDPIVNPVDKDPQVELQHFTLERATEKNSGHYLQGPVEIAPALGRAILGAYKIVEQLNAYYVLSSVPEGGTWENGVQTNHPYLIQYAPFIKKHAAENADRIPPETVELYRSLSKNIQFELQKKGDLNWPMQGTHYHLGLPVHLQNGKEVIDSRVALVNAHLRQTRFSKVLGLMLYGTSYFYGHQTNLKDVRSIARRALATTHDTSIPSTEEEYINMAITQVEKGLIPSTHRYPQNGQHGEFRIRERTIEDIGNSICSDLRAILAISFAQEIMDTIAKEVLVEAEGNETLAISLLKIKYGDVLETQSALGNNSSHEWDVEFNKNGYNNPKMLEAHIQVVRIVKNIGAKYPALKLNAKVVAHMMATVVKKVSNPNLQQRLGLDATGNYDCTLEIRGLVAEHKKGLTVEELIRIQHAATKAQAKALCKIETEDDLLKFFGISK